MLQWENRFVLIFQQIHYQLQVFYHQSQLQLKLVQLMQHRHRQHAHYKDDHGNERLNQGKAALAAILLFHCKHQFTVMLLTVILPVAETATVLPCPD